jgi:hypothetical protein
MNEGLSEGVDFCPITGTDCIAIADRSQASMATRLSPYSEGTGQGEAPPPRLRVASDRADRRFLTDQAFFIS